MIGEDKKAGATLGDIQQGRQRKAQASSYGIGQDIPGVTETTNTQGNRSFTGHRQAPAEISNQMSSAIAAESKPSSADFGMESTGIQQPTKTRKPTAVEQMNINSTKGGIGAGLFAKPTGPQKPSGTPYNEVFFSNDHNARLKANASKMAGTTGNTGTVVDTGNANTNTATINDETNQPEFSKPSSSGQPSNDSANAFGISGITEGLTEDGRRSFTGSGVGASGQVNTIDMGITDAQRNGRTGIANPEFERALASGNYEDALQAANRSDVDQMARLGQLGGQIRQQREADLRANKAGQVDPAKQAIADRMMRRASQLADEGSSKGAQRLVNMANGVKSPQKGISAGIVSNEVASYDEARINQANVDTAQAEASQARTTQQQQGILQGLIDQINSPGLGEKERKSVIQRYQALSGDSGFIETERVVGFDMDGSPVTAKVQINSATGQSVGGNDQFISDVQEGMELAAQQPEMRREIDARLVALYGRGLPQQTEN